MHQHLDVNERKEKKKDGEHAGTRDKWKVKDHYFPGSYLYKATAVALGARPLFFVHVALYAPTKSSLFEYNGKA